MNFLDYDATITDDYLCTDTERQQLKNFLDDGYLVVPPDDNFIKKIEQARDYYFEFKKKNQSITTSIQDEQGCLRRVVNLHCKGSPFAELFTSNPSLSFLDCLFQEATLYTSLVFEKGSLQDIHRDTPYFWTNPSYSYVGVWVALEDTDADNGPLRVVKGAHKLPELDRRAIASKYYPDGAEINPYSDELWLEYQGQLQEQYRGIGLEEKELHVPKGSTIIWHPQLPHGGTPIVDENRTRLSIAMHVTPPDLAVYHQDIFFGDGNADVPSREVRNYKYIDGRRYIGHETISLGHEVNYKLKEIA
jgi:ectoine hydroxylase-related dioxygenase (phytanoyl-CoA dioxygenase family)